VYRSMEKKKAV